MKHPLPWVGCHLTHSLSKRGGQDALSLALPAPVDVRFGYDDGMERPGRTLIISDGGMTSLLACGLAAEEADTSNTERPIVWIPEVGGDDPTTHKDAVLKQAQILSLELLTARVTEPVDRCASGLLESEILLHAGHLAGSERCGRVVWPVQLGAATTAEEPPLDRVAEAVDRALLVSRLISIDGDFYGLTEVAVDTPFVDLADEQVADLAAEMSLPIESCWWWTALGAMGSGADAERERWVGALRMIGWAGLPAGV